VPPVAGKKEFQPCIFFVSLCLKTGEVRFSCKTVKTASFQQGPEKISFFMLLLDFVQQFRFLFCPVFFQDTLLQNSVLPVSGK
jgi:hypothetical protein